jgi:hypothetical protein
MMLIDPKAVESQLIRELELRDVPAKIFPDLHRVAQLVIRRRYPDAFVLAIEVVWQITITLHVEQYIFHWKISEREPV